ncbi:hypothetical protein R1sor_022933 [Riccia sorocarpa]|uniref:Uncharacterized protein n=1 Tax=Riccia sorocarpa TaxID=122646 RepID=A0ABD3GNB7_9MARC
MEGFPDRGGISEVDVEQQSRRERKRLAQRKRRYENTQNLVRPLRLQMVEEANMEAEEIKRRALEDAKSIRHFARLSAEGFPGPSSLTSNQEMVPAGILMTRSVVDEASEILRFAQTFAHEARAEGLG